MTAKFDFGALGFSLKVYESRLLILSTWVFTFAFILALRWFCYRVAAWTGQLRVSTVIIGDADTAIDLVYAFASDPCSIHAPEIIILRGTDESTIDLAELPRGYRNLRVYGPDFSCDAFVAENPDYFYVVSMDTCSGEACDFLMQTLNRVRAAYAIVPSMTGANFYQMQPTYFFGHDVMLLQTRAGQDSRSLTSLRRMVKRLIDILVAGSALLVVSPILLIVGLMLKLEGQGGSIFYGGNRIGRGGRLFRCWKIRSMEPNSDHLLQAYLDSDPAIRAHWDKFRKLDRDPRVTTKTARLIRKTSFDEVPQLWNVLVGDMSLVGPRPILEDEVAYFEDKMDDYLSVRPGVTGLWQVSGRNDTSFKRRVYWDSWYVRNWTLWGDIVILIKTPLVLLMQKGVR